MAHANRTYDISCCAETEMKSANTRFKTLPGDLLPELSFSLSAEYNTERNLLARDYASFHANMEGNGTMNRSRVTATEIRQNGSARGVIVRPRCI